MKAELDDLIVKIDSHVKPLYVRVAYPQAQTLVIQAWINEKKLCFTGTREAIETNRSKAIMVFDIFTPNFRKF